MRRPTGWQILLLGVGLAGCTSDEEPGDSGVSDDPEGGEADSPQCDMQAGAARAWVLGDDTGELPEGGDFAGVLPGDLVLRNDHVFAAVRGQEPGLTVPGFYGGGLVDLHRPGLADRLREHIVMIGIREVRPTKFEVVADGCEGGAATVRVEGVDSDIHIIPEDFPIPSGAPLGATVATEYSLGPDDDFLTITTTIDRPDASMESLNAGDGLYISDPGEPFLPGAPRGADGPPIGTAPFVVQGGLAMVSDPPNPASLAFSIDNITGLLPATVQVAPGAPGSFSRRFYVGDPAKASAHLAARIRELEGVATGALAVTGVPDDAVIEVRKGAGKLAAVGDASGPFPVPAGDLTVTAFLEGRAGPEVAVSVAAGGEATVALTAPGHATLTLTAKDTEDAPLPARALVLPADGPRQIVLIPPAGTDVRVPAGELRVIVSRGFEYDVHDETVTVQDAGAASVAAVLDRVVDTPGAVSTDSHIHSIWSTDSKVPEATRVLSIAAEGVEMPVATDHDMVTLYRVPDELKAWVNPIVGVETSTSDFGHYNGYPLHAVRDPSLPRAGAPDWLGLQPAEVFDNMRAAGATVVQINHPIGDSGKDYFSAVGLTPDPATPGLPAGMAMNFDVLEIYNRGEDGQIEEVLGATHKILNSGKRVGFVGVSDSHDLARFVGAPRSHVLLGEDDPTAVTPDAFAEAIKAGRTVLTGGPYVEATVQVDGDQTSIEVKVQAPDWVPVDRVVVVTPDGAVAERTDMADGVVRFDDTIVIDTPAPLPANAGPAWLYVRADSARRMDPIMGGRVFSATSPFYLD